MSTVCVMRVCQALVAAPVSLDIKVQTVIEVSLLLACTSCQLCFLASVLATCACCLTCTPGVATCCVAELPECASLSCPQNSRCTEDTLTGRLSCQCRPGYHEAGDQCLREFQKAAQKKCAEESVTFMATFVFCPPSPQP